MQSLSRALTKQDFCLWTSSFWKLPRKVTAMSWSPKPHSWARNTLKIIICVNFRSLGMFSSVAPLDCSKPTVCCPITLCLGVIIERKFISIGRIFRSRCTWVGYFRNKVEQQLLPLHKQKKKELQTIGAGNELHICTYLRPDGDKKLHLVGKGVPSWPGKQREGTWILCPFPLGKGMPSHQMAWKKQIKAGSQTNQGDGPPPWQGGKSRIAAA